MSLPAAINKTPFISFEVFPPKTSEGMTRLKKSIHELKHLDPAYISVTYGAGGHAKRNSFSVCDYLNNHQGITTMAHYTCMGTPREEWMQDLKKLLYLNIKHYMLLRGDMPKSLKASTQESMSSDGDVNTGHYAYELVQAMRLLSQSACIGVAAYPEKHPEAPSLEADIDHLHLKLSSGADFSITQMFFDNALYFRFLRKARERGIMKPIIPGIMPINNFHQIDTIIRLSGSKLPKALWEALHTAKDNPKKFNTISTDFTIKQCNDLIRQGIHGLHFYTLNHSKQVMDILSEIDLRQKVENNPYHF